jgi:hypothetical protein
MIAEATRRVPLVAQRPAARPKLRDEIARLCPPLLRSVSLLLEKTLEGVRRKSSRTCRRWDDTALAAVARTELSADGHAPCFVAKDGGEPRSFKSPVRWPIARLVLHTRARNHNPARTSVAASPPTL